MKAKFSSYCSLSDYMDVLLKHTSNTLNILYGKPAHTRIYPAASENQKDFNEQDKKLSARYMRVNHTGEICAQALYQSQALTSSNSKTRMQMQQAADEELDHLAWCGQRIDELNGRKSLLNPVWYAGSFAIGTLAGIAGDKWNLGFVAETEKQVVDHLEKHLGQLPKNDIRSREVITQIKTDEAHHASQAIKAGAAKLPLPVKGLMRVASGIMTRVTYRL